MFVVDGASAVGLVIVFELSMSLITFQERNKDWQSCRSRKIVCTL